MKRSGFKPRRYVTPPPAPPRRLERCGVLATIYAVPRPVPKVKPVVCEEYRRLVRQLPCAPCGHVGATQFCHADQDKGMGSKTDDRLGWAACGPHDGTMGCHYLVGSSGHYPRERRRCLEQVTRPGRASRSCRPATGHQSCRCGRANRLPKSG